VIELVDRFEADDPWRVALPLEHGGRKERRFETMGFAVAHDAAEGAECLAIRLVVVRQAIEVRLNLRRRPERVRESPLARRQSDGSVFHSSN